MSLTPGHQLGAYQILEPIGKGAQGEVYRARDTKLGREVAIKVLPEGDADRLARFEREAGITGAELMRSNMLKRRTDVFSRMTGFRAESLEKGFGQETSRTYLD